MTPRKPKRPTQDSHMNVDYKRVDELAPGDQVVLVQTIATISRTAVGFDLVYEDGTSQHYEPTSGVAVPKPTKAVTPAEPPA